MRLRLAESADAARLLVWRNDPATREGSFTSDEVDPDAHTRWLAGRLSDPDSRLWIATVGEEPVGQVRLDRLTPARAEISISVALEHRGRGYGAEMLKAAGNRARREAFAEEIVARVKPGNTASLRLFEGAGYLRISESPAEVVLAVRPSPR